MNTEPNVIEFPRPSGHLTEAQFAELLAGPADVMDRTLAPARAVAPAEEHLLTCAQCANELAELREAITLFRDASTAYANQQLRNIEPIAVRARGFLSPPVHRLRPMYFAAVAALVLAAFVPLRALHQRSLQPAAPAVTTTAAASSSQTATSSQAASSSQYATESDDALLEDVDRAASASLPESMQVLADPTDNSTLSVRNSNQRKD